jgi:hypothetical protein
MQSLLHFREKNSLVYIDLLLVLYVFSLNYHGDLPTSQDPTYAALTCIYFLS